MIARRRTPSWPFLASGLLHAVALAVLSRIAVPAVPPPAATNPSASTLAVDRRTITHLVFIPAQAPGGGGGGGGNRQPGPIRRAEARGKDRITLRVAPPPPTMALANPIEPALPGVVLDARPLSSGAVDALGLPEGGVPFGTSLGPGTGGGVGEGTGTGIGSGTGPGLGMGSGGGFGGGVHRPGGGVSAPTVIREVKPSYPPDALEARIQGSVAVALVVTSDGLPADIRIVRSLAPDLDEAALRAVREWRFKPGRIGQTPVNVAVTIVLDFAIH